MTTIKYCTRTWPGEYPAYLLPQQAERTELFGRTHARDACECCRPPAHTGRCMCMCGNRPAGETAP